MPGLVAGLADQFVLVARFAWLAYLAFALGIAGLAIIAESAVVDCCSVLPLGLAIAAS